MAEKLCYENYLKILQEKYGKKNKYLMFVPRMDCLYAPSTDFTYIVKEGDRESAKYLMDNIDGFAGKQCHYSERDFAVVASCFALESADGENTIKVPVEEVVETLLFEAGFGDISRCALIAGLVNAGKEKTAKCIKEQNGKEIGKIIGTVLGRQITEWKMTYNSDEEYNTSDKMERRLALGLNALRFLEFLTRHPECASAVSKRRLECAKIMAEKAQIYIDAFETEQVLVSHGRAVEYRMPEIDPANGKNMQVSGKCVYEDGFELTEREFCQLQLNRILPYVRENAPNRDFTGFEQRLGKYGMVAIRALYERAGREVFDVEYAGAEDVQRKETFEKLKNPEIIAHMVEKQAMKISNESVEEYIKENYLSFGHYVKFLIHRISGLYDKNVQSASLYVLLNGGKLPEDPSDTSNFEVKENTVKSILKAYSNSYLDGKLLSWPIGKGEPVALEPEAAPDGEEEHRMTTDEAVEAFKNRRAIQRKQDREIGK